MLVPHRLRCKLTAQARQQPAERLREKTDVETHRATEYATEEKSHHETMRQRAVKTIHAERRDRRETECHCDQRKSIAPTITIRKLRNDERADERTERLQGIESRHLLLAEAERLCHVRPEKVFRIPAKSVKHIHAHEGREHQPAAGLRVVMRLKSCSRMLCILRAIRAWFSAYRTVCGSFR